MYTLQLHNYWSLFLSRKIFRRHLRYQLNVPHCLKIHTVSSCQWRTRTTWKQDCGSSLKAKLVLTMEVWQGIAVMINMYCTYYIHIVPLENGFAFCLMRYSIRIMGCLSMQQGMFATYSNHASLSATFCVFA